MKKIFITLLIITIVFSSSSIFSADDLVDNCIDYDFTSVDNFLENAVETVPLDGCVLLLIKDGQTIYKKAFGTYTTETVVPIASATKWVSAVLIMDLVDDGVLSLDDKVSDWIFYYSDLSDKKDITIGQMFSHASGFPSSALCLNFQGPNWNLEKCAESISKLKMEELPGTVFRYGGVGMQLAGRVVEIAANDNWIDLYKERIADPLGITTIVWDEKYPNTKNPRIAGGIAAISVDDYSKLLQMMLNEGTYQSVEILSPETVDFMLTDQTFGLPVASSPYTKYNNHPHLGYGIGAWIDSKNKDGGAVELSSTGAWGYHPWIDLNRNMTGVFLVKSRLTNIYEIEVELRYLIRDIVGENKAPYIPDAPNGQKKGEINTEYEFSAVTTDPKNDMVSYVFDWGDGTNSGWSGFVDSGTYVTMNHSWSKKNSYNVRVKSRDEHGTESRWSEPLSITMPKNIITIDHILYILIIRFFSNYLNFF